MIEAGAAIYRREGCDYLIGIGGGSPLDAAKAIAATLVNPGPLSDYQGREMENPRLRCRNSDDCGHGQRGDALYHHYGRRHGYEDAFKGRRAASGSGGGG